MYRYYTTERQAMQVTMPVRGWARFHNYDGEGITLPHIGHVLGYGDYTEPLSDDQCTLYKLVPAGEAPSYYPIDENAAREAKRMNSFSDYVEGSVTEDYQRMVDRAACIAYHQKQTVDKMHHERIDHLLDSYARQLAGNYNADLRNQGRCPSILIAGGSNFPVRKKQRQNERDDRIREEYARIQGLLDRIKSTGKGGISADDPDALDKLREKRDRLLALQARMKAANAALRKKDKAAGDKALRELGYNAIEIMHLRTPDMCGRVGYPQYELSNNNANIHRVETRIAELERRNTEPEPEGWLFGDGEVVVNSEINRLQVVFVGKPDEETREELKSNGFRWAPSQGAWQRQLTPNALRAAKRMKCLRAPDAAAPLE